MDKLSSLMVLVSLVTSNIYIADSYTLTPSVLNQLGYNTQSTSIDINDDNIDKMVANSLSGYGNLRYFSIGSGIKTIDVHSFELLSNLSTLDLRKNLITGFEYLQIPKQLNVLILRQNNMNYFGLSRTMGVLKTLDISKNRFRSFKSMDFTFLANLTSLYLNDNPHAYPNEIPGHMKPLVNLITVHLENLSISSIDSNFFKTNTKLKYVYLSKNNISRLDNRSFTWLNDIQTLYLNDNNLAKIASGTFQISNSPNLAYVDLSNNQISQIENSSFYGNDQMSVELSNNQLTKIPPRIFEGQFQYIDLNYNQITEIDSLSFNGVSRVRNLYLMNNKIEKIKTGSFNFNITALYLTGNLLTQLGNGSFIGQISALYLLNNRIENIENGAFNYGNITAINLEGNSLIKISNMTFAGMNQLKHLVLNSNRLSTIEPGSFANLPTLNNIFLENNQLTQLDSSMFSGSNNLQGIYLKGNPNLSTANLQSLCPPAAINCHVYY